ncbi:hypothetical protein [Sphaerisporangium fuscum]|uniref:hypothetical protein n=1 Tax=Sphaerisporangium fuscum TaxID=2835868 RepID=UPI001BDBD14E|nr:hypothetical protein [Sphaerisporangium fuscum]
MAALALVVASVWIGMIYHATLRLPREQQEHGLKVLAQLTELFKAITTRPQMTPDDQPAPTPDGVQQEVSDSAQRELEA